MGEENGRGREGGEYVSLFCGEYLFKGGCVCSVSVRLIFILETVGGGFGLAIWFSFFYILLFFSFF